MATFYPTGSGGSGTSSDELTATKGNVLAGKTAITSDSDDEAAAGTMTDQSGAVAGGTPAAYNTNYVKVPISSAGYYDASDYLYVNDSNFGTATAAQVLSGNTFTSDAGFKTSGTIASLAGGTYTAGSSAQTISCSGKYMTSNVVINAASSITNLTAENIKNGVTIAGITGTYKGLGNATAENVLSGKTFSTASLSNATGTMPSLSNNATITYTSSNTTPVIEGDAAFYGINSDNAYRVNIRYQGDNGYLKTNTLFGVTPSIMQSAIGLTAAKVKKGVSIMGVTGTCVPTVAAIGGMSIKLASDSDTSSVSDSFTVPSSATYCIVYYGGMAANYNGGNRTVTCQISKNGTVVDSRNIDSDNNYSWRGTMFNKSFTASAGDVIKVDYDASNGHATGSFATMQAVIIYYT